MPYNFEPQSKLLRTLILSSNRQAVWNASMADAAFTQIQRFDGSAVLDFQTDRRSDKEYSGKGSWFATNGQITEQMLKISGLKSELSPWLAGWLFAFCMGKDVTVGSASPYAHTFSFDQSTRQAVPTSIYMQDTTDLIYRIPDLALNDFTLTISDKGAIMADYNLVGTGRFAVGAQLAALASNPATLFPPVETYLLGSDADFQWGNVGAPVSKLGRHTQTTLKIDHQMVAHRATGLGLYSAFIRKGDPKFSLSSTVAASTPDDIFTRYVNNTQTAIAIPIVSGPLATLTINVPACNIKTTKMGFDGDMTIWNIEMDETTCYQAAGVQPITVTLTSADPAFLVAHV